VPRNDANLMIVRQFQSETDALREAQEPVRARIAVLALVGLLAALLAITFFAKIDRVITSTGGKIVATETPSVFQALDPSIIKSIDVKEGDRVPAGALLATLDPTFTTADVEQLKQQVAGLEAQIARATAEQRREPMAVVDAANSYIAPYYALQHSLYDQRAAAYQAQLNSYDEKMSQAEATIQKMQEEGARYQDEEKIAQQIEDMRTTLQRSGAGSLLNLLQSTASRLEATRSREFDHNSLVESQHLLASLKADRETLTQQWFSAVSQEIVTAQNALDSARAQLSKAEKHQDLVRLTAPEPEMVLSIAKISVGSVLKEGDPLMTLVPLRTPMEAEIRIASRDVGFIRPGDPCTLKIDAFNFFEHGTADGTLRWISEDAFTADDDGKATEAYYRARIRIDHMNFVGVPENFRLIPGMTLIGDVKIGTRSVFKFLLGGFIRGLGEAMREP